jgi:hypothetical protein
MPLDATGYAPSPRVLTPIEERDLAVLKAARHRIRNRWMWIKYSEHVGLFRQIVGRCAIEALKSRSDRDRDCEMRLKRQMPVNDRGNMYSCVIAYNDARSTTHVDILALFDRAIAEIEG